MDSKLRLVLVLFLLSILTRTSQGAGECTKSDVKLTQEDLGTGPAGRAVIRVTLHNTCSCTISELVLYCAPPSLPPVIGNLNPPDILLPPERFSPGQCRLNNIIDAGKSLTFTYQARRLFPYLAVTLARC